MTTVLRPRDKVLAAALTAVALAAGAVAVARASGPGARGAGPAPGAGRAPAATAVATPALEAAISRAHPAGPLSPAAMLDLSIGLVGRHAAQLERLVDQGRTVPAGYYDRHFGPSPGAVTRLRHWLGESGLRTHWRPGDSLLSASGPASQVEKAFSVAINRYRATGAGGRPAYFYAPDHDPVLPRWAAKVVTSVVGLDDYDHYSTVLDQTASTQCGTSSALAVGGFTPASVSGFYNFTPLYKAGLDGAGQTVVFMEIDGFQSSDLQAYANAFNLPAFQVTGPIIPVSSGLNGPIAFQGCASETELDLEVVHALAPQARLVVYQSSGNQADVGAALQAAVDAYPHAIFNLSLGGCEQAAVARQSEAAFTQLNAHGGSAFVSSGDSGAYVKNCPGHQLSVEQPASSPNATAVGGTTAFLGAGSTYGQEAIWGEPFEQWGAGGGLSAVFPRPSWQTGPGVVNQYSNGKREVPDVAAIADGNTGWDIFGGGAWTMVGGTSAAAPLWAALTALANQALSEKGLPQVGLANPALYAFGAQPSHFPGRAFHTVTEGDNLYYQATSASWNYGVGWGSPNAAAAVDDFLAYAKGTR